VEVVHVSRLIEQVVLKRLDKLRLGMSPNTLSQLLVTAHVAAGALSTLASVI